MLDQPDLERNYVQFFASMHRDCPPLCVERNTVGGQVHLHVWCRVHDDPAKVQERMERDLACA